MRVPVAVVLSFSSMVKMAAGVLSTETANIVDSFKQSADTYERRVGTVTRAVARHLVSSIITMIPSTAVVCDNACGTGAVTDAFLDASSTIHVYATDNSASMLDIMRHAVKNKHRQDQVHVDYMDSVQLGFPDDTFDANIMNFGIFFTSDEQQAANAIWRTQKKDGVVALTCWKQSPLGPIFFDVQDLVRPAQPIAGLSNFEKWSDPHTLESILRSAGFPHVKMEDFEVIQTAKTLANLVVSLSENIEAIVGEKWTVDEKKRIPWAVESMLLTEGDNFLVIDEDDKKGVSWVAWIATARK